MNRLKELRKEKRLTLRELAEQLHMTNSSISMMENEQRGISNDNLKTFCDFFNVSSDYLLGISDIRQPSHQSDTNENLQFALYGSFKKLSEEDKKKIIEYAELLAEKSNNTSSN